MHWKRWITSLIILPPLLLLILKGGPVVFGIAVMVVGMITQWEYYRIVFRDHSPDIPLFYPIWGYLNGAAIVAAAICNHPDVILALLAINLLGAAFLSIFRFKSCQDAPLVVLKQVFGVIYIPVFLSFGVLLYNGAQGSLWLLFLIWVVAIGDATAFYVGTYWGCRKLCPSVSPKKSVEGALGGLTANIVFGLIFKILFLSQVSVVSGVLFSLVVGIIGQAGDLFESEFKRAAGIKDSSGLLPGHGGFLDRLDALLFAAPVAYLLKEYILP